jgi:hypothetical protein
MYVKVRWLDMEITQLAIIRCSREWCGHVRAALTFWNSLPLDDVSSKRQATVITSSHNTKRTRLFVTASVVSVHGSARTAKLATMARVRSHFRQQMEQNRRFQKRKNQDHQQDERKPQSSAISEADLQRLESMLKDIDKIDAEQFYVKEEPTTATAADTEDDE